MTGLDRELLIEIGCEEIPASWLPGLTAQLATHLDARLKYARLTPASPAETYSTPRRLTARVLQPRVEMRGELRRQAGQPARRDLLAADLDQQFAVHQSPSRTLTPAFISSSAT